MPKNSSNNYIFYFGIPHAHTGYSSGIGNPTSAYKYSLQNGLNFIIITDHANSLKEKLKVKDKEIDKWKELKKESRNFSKKLNNYLSLYGFELHTCYGDINIIASKNFLDGTIKDWNELLKWLQNEKNAICSINHPHKTVLSIPYSKELNEYINLIEVGNGSSSNKYMRYDKTFFSMLDKGWKLGAINGQDNHKEDWGDTDNITVVIGKEFSKSDFYSSLRERHTYSSESKDLKLIFLANGALMGSSLTANPSDKITLQIMAENYKDYIEGIQIITNGGKVLENKNLGKISTLKFNCKYLVRDLPVWLLVRVFLSGHKEAITSPIFIESPVSPV